MKGPRDECVKRVEDVTSSFKAPARSAISFQNLPKVEIKNICTIRPKRGPLDRLKS